MNLEFRFFDRLPTLGPRACLTLIVSLPGADQSPFTAVGPLATASLPPKPRPDPAARPRPSEDASSATSDFRLHTPDFGSRTSDFEPHTSDFPPHSALAEACAWLADRLTHGPRPAAQLLRDAGAAGLSVSTLRRAKRLLAVRSFKRAADEGWLWAAHQHSRLPNQPPQFGNVGNLEPPARQT
jgi:hypothetical protein